MDTMNNPTPTPTTPVTVTMTYEEWNLISTAIICGIGGRKGDSVAVDIEEAQKMHEIYWWNMKVSY